MNALILATPAGSMRGAMSTSTSAVASTRSSPTATRLMPPPIEAPTSTGRRSPSCVDQAPRGRRPWRPVRRRRRAPSPSRRARGRRRRRRGSRPRRASRRCPSRRGGSARRRAAAARAGRRGSPQASPASATPALPFQWCIGSGVPGSGRPALIADPGSAPRIARCSSTLSSSEPRDPGCPWSTAIHPRAFVVAGDERRGSPRDCPT